MLEFLRRILPSNGGFFCIVGIKKGIVKPRFFSTLDGIDELAAKLSAAEFNVYFACATYNDDATGRKAENIKALKSFFLDIDCGEGKPYATKESGLEALKKFVKDNHLPKPWIVDSGGGIHAYWELTTEVAYAEWKYVADKFKLLCKEQDFDPDPAVTSDGARILRLPGTNNLKDLENPRPVTVLLEGKAVDFESFKQKINPIQTWVAPKHGWRDLDPVTKALLGKNFVSSFDKILTASVEGRGCEQIKWIYENQSVVSEPLWRAGLSIAAFCEDGDEAIHTISEKYPKYSRDETIHKVSLIKGPYTCEKFSELGDASFCKNCQYGKETNEKPKVRSPISIGRVIAEAKDEERFVTQFDNTLNEVVTYEIPPYPAPYFRREGGGVCRRSWHEEDKDKVIYDHDLYIIKRYHDPDEGYVATVRLHTPKDGMVEFNIPTSQVVSLETIKTLLSKHGVYCYTNQFGDIQAYLQYSLQKLQQGIRAEIAQPRMGWLDGYKAFILGSKEISAAGVINGPPSKYTKAVAKHVYKRGTLEEWKKVPNLFNDTPGMEPHAFTFLSAFGAPLMEFTELYGATFIAKSEGSGTGKTMTLFTINSVWGHPKDIMVESDDTPNFKLNRVGMMCNLPVCFDEMSNHTGEQLSDLFYSITSGRGRGRMERQSNVERTNYNKWKTIVLFSSNQESSSKLLEIKRSPQAELARFLEFEFKKNPILEARLDRLELTQPLFDNFGIAGEIYAQYIVEHQQEIREARLAMQRKLVRAINPKPGSIDVRFWIVAISCNLVGGIIATRLGLIDYDMPKIYKWIVKYIDDIRAEVLVDDAAGHDPLSDYLLHMWNNTLVINAGKKGMLGEAPIREPKGPPYVRYEPDTNRVYVVVAQFREYCAKRNIHHKSLIARLMREKICLEVKKMKLLRGTHMPLASYTTSHCLVLDNSKVDYDALTSDSSRSDVSDPATEVGTGNVGVHTDLQPSEAPDSSKTAIKGSE